MCAALLKELMNSDGGDSQSPDLSRQLDEAQRLVKEMEKRDFNPQKAAAEKEREEARKCESSSCLLTPRQPPPVPCRRPPLKSFSVPMHLLQKRPELCCLGNGMMVSLGANKRFKNNGFSILEENTE
jgi:hypothetical protein